MHRAFLRSLKTRLVIHIGDADAPFVSSVKNLGVTLDSNLSHSLKMSCSPYLMKLHNMYHLETPIEGVLQEQYDVFDIIKALHLSLIHI